MWCGGCSGQPACGSFPRADLPLTNLTALSTAKSTTSHPPPLDHPITSSTSKSVHSTAQRDNNLTQNLAQVCTYSCILCCTLHITAKHFSRTTFQPRPPAVPTCAVRTLCLYLTISYSQLFHLDILSVFCFISSGIDQCCLVLSLSNSYC